MTGAPTILVRYRRVTLAIATAFLIAIAIVSAIDRNEPPLAKVFAVTAETGQRAISARIVGFPYGQPPKRDREASQESQHRLAFRVAAAKVLAADRGDSHVAAITALLVEKTTEGAAALERLTKREPANAVYWSDLAAARHEDAQIHDDPAMEASALAAVDRALDLRADLPEALFNRTLILDALGLRTDAADAAQRYLAIDATTPWATEIRVTYRFKIQTNRNAWNDLIPTLTIAVQRDESQTVERIVRQFPQQARTWAEGDFLGRWADAAHHGRAASATLWLDIARAVGAALHRTSGERLLDDAVAAIDREHESGTVATLIAAHRAYRDGRVLYSRRDVTAALPLLRDAGRAFHSGDSPMGHVAAYFEANALFDSNERGRATEIADDLHRNVPVDYLALRAQVEWLRGTIGARTGRPFEALLQYQTALAAFDRLNEKENATRMRGGIASLFSLLGQNTEAWRMRVGVFRDADAAGTPWLMEVTFNDAARNEIGAQRFDVARSILRLELSRKETTPRLRFDALLWLAYVEKQFPGKPMDLTAAAAAANRMAAGGLREDACDELRFVQAVHGSVDSERAVELLTQCISYRNSVGRTLLARDAYVERGRVYRRLGRDGLAISDLKQAIGIIESTSEAEARTHVRDTFFSSSHDAYEELTDLFVKSGRYADAFEVSDRGRGRVFTDRTATSGIASIRALQQRLGKDTVVAHYTALTDQLLVVAINGAHWHGQTIPVSRQQLKAHSERLQSSIVSNNRDALAREATGMYDIVIRALHRYFPATKLVVVPDETTAGVPFAALRSPSGRWLVEDIAIVVAPSAAAYAHEPGVAKIHTATVVADPAFDSRLFPGLGRLNAARAEGHAVQALAARSRFYVGAQATRAAVTAAFGASELIHIAAHARSDSRDASQSLIVLAADRNDNGVLYSRDIADLDLTNTRCVVLTACQTAAAGGGRGSVRSIALSFLAAGALSVLASSWDTRDDVAREVSRGFYQATTAGLSPSSAIRDTQISMIRRGDPPRDWASFQILVANRGIFKTRTSND